MVERRPRNAEVSGSTPDSGSNLQSLLNIRRGRELRAKKPRANCLCCGIECKRPQDRYCGTACQLEWQHREYIVRWQAGKESGVTSGGLDVSNYIRRYLFEKYGSKCRLCSWSKVNPSTGKIPLVVNHINGNSEDCSEVNLELLCPSCDSLTPTYMALNKGNGRKVRQDRRKQAAFV